jgi:MFS family permease
VVLADRDEILRDRRFLLLAGARTTSVFGNGLGRIALAFGVLALPGATAGRLSLVLTAQALPQVAFVLLGGLLGDRFSRIRLMICADLLAGVAYVALATMVLTGRAPLAGLLIAAGLAGIGSALFQPASSGLLPEFVPAGLLQSANAWLRMGQNIALLAGLSASGVVVALAGAGWALALDGLSFTISAGLVSLMRLPVRIRTIAGSAGSYWSELRHGWREFVSRQWLWVVVAQFSFLLAAISATTGVLGPLLADRDYGGARSWAVLIALQAFGTVIGAGFARKIRVHRPIAVAVLATAPLALPMLTLGLGAPLWLSGVAMFCCGIAVDIFGVLWSTTMQREIPGEVLSRVSAYDIFGSIALAPLGLLVAGPLGIAIGLRPALVCCGCLALLATGAALLSPSVRTLRSPEAQLVS